MFYQSRPAAARLLMRPLPLCSLLGGGRFQFNTFVIAAQLYPPLSCSAANLLRVYIVYKLIPSIFKQMIYCRSHSCYHTQLHFTYNPRDGILSDTLTQSTENFLKRIVLLCKFPDISKFLITRGGVDSCAAKLYSSDNGAR